MSIIKYALLVLSIYIPLSGGWLYKLWPIRPQFSRFGLTKLVAKLYTLYIINSVAKLYTLYLIIFNYLL